eukprot:scaffold6767_cov108-Skeletonema_marinoi.AAC.3
MADHFSKQLPPTFFARHVDHILGHVPPRRTHHNTISLLELSTTLPSTQSPVPPISHTIISDNDDVNFSSVGYVEPTNKLVSDWALIVYHRPR